MRKIIIICLVLTISIILSGKELGILSDILKPQLLEVKNEKLYIIEGAAVYIYSAKNLKLLKKFGKKGEGPGELQVLPFLSNIISVHPEFLFVQGLNKIIYFTHEGKLIKETRKNPYILKIIPLGKNFVGVVSKLIPGKNQEFHAVCIYNEELKEKKELLRREIFPSAQKLLMIPRSMNFTVYNNKIFVENSKKGLIVIEVFDADGNVIHKIEKKVEPIKVNDYYKKLSIENLKEDNLVKLQMKPLGGWEEFKKLINMQWPDFLPEIKDILVSENKIYLQTYKEKNNRVEYLIMDIDGKNQKSVFLPKVKEPSFINRMAGKGTRFFDIENNKFYYLYEDDENEEWIVHMEEI